jgi:hypothetical protein
MNTLPQAFKTRRVKETLVALSQHVETAITLARLDPVQTSEPELSGDILPPLPEVTTIPIVYVGSTFTIEGDYLDEVSKIYLIRIGEVGPWIATNSGDFTNLVYNNTVDPPRVISFEAEVDLTKAPHGHYNLLLIDSYGQTVLVRNAYTIKPRPFFRRASRTALRARSKAKS